MTNDRFNTSGDLVGFLQRHLPYQFEIYDIATDTFSYAYTFERAVRLMRQSYDAKITRISDNVVLAQNQLGDD
jgi:hypothetical protein